MEDGTGHSPLGAPVMLFSASSPQRVGGKESSLFFPNSDLPKVFDHRRFIGGPQITSSERLADTKLQILVPKPFFLTGTWSQRRPDLLSVYYGRRLGLGIRSSGTWLGTLLLFDLGKPPMLCRFQSDQLFCFLIYTIGLIVVGLFEG